jgi:hypothetical protein
MQPKDIASMIPGKEIPVLEKCMMGRLKDIDPDIVDMASKFQSLLERRFILPKSSIFVQICKKSADIKVNMNPVIPNSPKKTDVKICKISISASH